MTSSWDSTPAGKAHRRRYAAHWKATNRKKYLAQKAAQNAVQRGRMVPCPCEACGKEPAVAHHDDYDKPLEVRWLCVLHHAQWHRMNGEGRNAHTPVVPRPKSSRFRGVTRAKKRFVATVKVNGVRHKTKGLTEIGAALAYDEMALRFFGDKAILNFPESRKRSA